MLLIVFNIVVDYCQAVHIVLYFCKMKKKMKIFTHIFLFIAPFQETISLTN